MSHNLICRKNRSVSQKLEGLQAEAESFCLSLPIISFISASGEKVYFTPFSEPLVCSSCISPGQAGIVVKIICFPVGTIRRFPEVLCTLNTEWKLLTRQMMLILYIEVLRAKEEHPWLLRGFQKKRWCVQCKLYQTHISRSFIQSDLCGKNIIYITYMIWIWFYVSAKCL